METKEIEEKVLIALDEIRPFLASDGGDISLVGIEKERLVKSNFTVHAYLVLSIK